MLKIACAAKNWRCDWESGGATCGDRCGHDCWMCRKAAASGIRIDCDSAFSHRCERTLVDSFRKGLFETKKGLWHRIPCMWNEKSSRKYESGNKR